MIRLSSRRQMDTMNMTHLNINGELNGRHAHGKDDLLRTETMSFDDRLVLLCFGFLFIWGHAASTKGPERSRTITQTP